MRMRLIQRIEVMLATSTSQWDHPSVTLAQVRGGTEGGLNSPYQQIIPAGTTEQKERR